MSTPVGAKLEQLIRAFVGGLMLFPEYSRDFSETYIEQGEGLDDAEITLYGPVHERLEWTIESPPAADRAWGWIEPTELREWLVSHSSER